MIVNSEPKTDRKNNIEYGKIVGSIAGIMKQQGALSSGEMAELRRISQDQPFTPALWRLLIMLNLTEPPPGSAKMNGSDVGPLFLWEWHIAMDSTTSTYR